MQTVTFDNTDVRAVGSQDFITACPIFSTPANVTLLESLTKEGTDFLCKALELNDADHVVLYERLAQFQEFLEMNGLYE